MLRRRVPVQRNPSICAFCQHRLALRQAHPPPQRRWLSASSRLQQDDGPAGGGAWRPPAATRGWGAPAFAASKPTPPTPSPGSLGAGAEADLLPHELALRQRLAESRKAKLAEDGRTSQFAVDPNPGVAAHMREPRHKWNSEVQRRVQDYVAREASQPLRPPPPPRGKPADPFRHGDARSGVMRSSKPREPLDHAAPLDGPSVPQRSPRSRRAPSESGSTSPSAFSDLANAISPTNRSRPEQERPASRPQDSRPTDQRPYTAPSKERAPATSAALDWIQGMSANAKAAEEPAPRASAAPTPTPAPTPSPALPSTPAPGPASGGWGRGAFANVKAPEEPVIRPAAAPPTRGWGQGMFANTKPPEDLSLQTPAATGPGSAGRMFANQKPTGFAREEDRWPRQNEGGFSRADGPRNTGGFSRTDSPQNTGGFSGMGARSHPSRLNRAPDDRQGFRLPGFQRQSNQPSRARETPLGERSRPLDNSIYTNDAWKNHISQQDLGGSQREFKDSAFPREVRHFDEPSKTASPGTAHGQHADTDVTSTWGSLARKQAAEKPSREDFWSSMESFTRQEPAQPPPQASRVDGWPRTSTVTPQRYNQPRSYQPPQTENPNRQSKPSPAQERRAGADEYDDHYIERSVGRQKKAASYSEPVAPQRRGQGGKKRGDRSSRFIEEDEEDYDAAYEQYMARKREKEERKARREAERAGPPPIVLPELINIAHLADALKVEKNLFLTQLGELGFEGVSLDSVMAGDTAALVAQEYGYDPTVDTGSDQDLKPRPPPEDTSLLPPRPPVVTIMGHVDHGKTTLLDYLRKSSVVSQEHGGITQHIGAFSVNLSSGKNITFLDTPGHAAFLSMRQRGANVTDIVVLVVAADDSVKPQTIEAIKHAQGAKVPMIVAITKVDREGARIEQVKTDLANNGVEIEDYGGDVQVVCVSGVTGQGMEDLEENILALSEMLDQRAELDGPVEGWIIESSVKPIGRVATVLVKRGTLRLGDIIAAGTVMAKVRQLRNEAGVDMDEAPPGTPVEVMGWRELPEAGDMVLQAASEGRARDAISYRINMRDREKDARDQEKANEQRRLKDEQRALAKEEQENAGESKKRRRREYGTWGTQDEPEVEGMAKMINFVVKGDVHGSVEAVEASILELGSHEVRPRVLRALPGHIVESDVEHAAASGSVIVNFNLPVAANIKAMADAAGVRILEHNIIYRMVDEVKQVMSSYLTPDVTINVLGEADVMAVFPINIKGRQYKSIAGCRIRNGTVGRSQMFRVLRKGETIYEGKVESLKHVKKDIDEARKGSECGIGFESFQDFQVGDQIQGYEEVVTQRSL